jgi:CO/xanthine dehydrogenase Mo-binding subunit
MTPAPDRATGIVGVARARTDSNEKVRGSTRYAADMPMVGLLHARIVPSLYAHARIEFAAKLHDFGSGQAPVEGHASTVQKSLAPSVSAHIAHVRLDRETGEVSVLGSVVAQDVGKALNPALVEGQMRGAAAQGIGWALYEALIHDEGGQLLSGSWLDYAVPRAVHVPDIDTLVMEVPAPDGPFGAKGIAEAPVIPAGAAVAAAIVAAGGPRLRILPMTGRRIWAALQGASAGGG